MKNIVCFLFLLNTVFCFSQEGLSYQLFSSKGKKTTYKKLLKAAEKSELILFGELHNNSVSHQLQLSLTEDLYRVKSLILGAEMFEADNQTELNDYLSGEIDQETFQTQARLWSNYQTDYKPLVEFAKENKLKFIATNIPRRYASMVYKGGFKALDTLSINEKEWIAPLPIEYDASLSQYQKMLEMGGGHAGENLPKAQAIKDATMGYFIANNMQMNQIFIHYHGTYHSDFYQGIYWYVKKEQPSLKIITIATVIQKDISKLEKEQLEKADFIIVARENENTTENFD